MINKRLINTGVAAAAAFDPLQNFETVTYTGNGGTQKITGYIRKGAAFNGSSSKIISPYTSTSQTTTISMWVNVVNISTTREYFTDSTNRWIISNGSGSSSNLSIFDGSTWIPTGTDLTANTWQHVCVVRDGNDATVYLDGSSIYTTSSANSDSIGSSLTFGAGYTGGNEVNGKIDQVRIFDKALSSSEVTTLYGETYASSTKSTTDIFGDGSGVALYELDEDANSSNFGQAAVFNGSSSVVNLGNNFNTIVSNDFSISAWVNVSSMGGQIFGKGIWAINGEYIRLYTRTSTPRIQFGFEDGSGNNVSMSTNSTDLTGLGWKHIVAIGDYTNGKYKLYLDGVLLEEQNISGSLNMTNTESARIGNRESNNGPFNGSIDQVRIYSSALSSSDVTNLYNESSVPTANLVAHYKLDGNATDETGSYDGTASNVTYSAGVYGGTPTNVNFLGMAFQPDLVWIKNRTIAPDHVLFDSIRGVQKFIRSNTTDNEGTATDMLSSFDTNGFTIGSATNTGSSGDNFVAWCWKAGGSAVSNTDGSITSTVSANQAAGFSIVKYTGDGSSSSTVGHGLSSTPELVIIKNTSDAFSWAVRHSALASTDNLYLNATNGATPVSSTAHGGVGSLSSTTIGFLSGATTLENINTLNDNYIAYCFHSVDGYQKVGSYTGGTGEVDVTTGFKPRWVMIKNTSNSANWVIFDSIRSGTTNPINDVLEPDTSDIEVAVGTAHIDIVDNGFQVNNTTSFSTNNNGDTYIYLAIA